MNSCFNKQKLLENNNNHTSIFDHLDLGWKSILKRIVNLPKRLYGIKIVQVALNCVFIPFPEGN